MLSFRGPSLSFATLVSLTGMAGRVALLFKTKGKFAQESGNFENPQPIGGSCGSSNYNEAFESAG